MAPLRGTQMPHLPSFTLAQSMPSNLTLFSDSCCCHQLVPPHQVRCWAPSPSSRRTISLACAAPGWSRSLRAPQTSGAATGGDRQSGGWYAADRMATAQQAGSDFVIAPWMHSVSHRVRKRRLPCPAQCCLRDARPHTPPHFAVPAGASPTCPSSASACLRWRASSEHSSEFLALVCCSLGVSGRTRRRVERPYTYVADMVLVTSPSPLSITITPC